MKPQFYDPNKQNKLERDYGNYLHLLKMAEEIVDYRYEPMGLRLGFKTFYKPDFLVIKKDRFEIHECKGFMRDDANVKLKVAAQAFPWFKFFLVRRAGKSWDIKEVQTSD